MRIDYTNMPVGSSKTGYKIRYIYNMIRTWYKFHIIFPWVSYNGFVRVLPKVFFAKGFNIDIGNNVQFGRYTSISCNAKFHNNILLAQKVSFVGKNDHQIDIAEKLIWEGEHSTNNLIEVEDDVWIGEGAIVVGPLTIGKGSVIAAGAVVTHSVPPCEVWGGVPAKKIRDRFVDKNEKQRHIAFLSNYSSKL